VLALRRCRCASSSRLDRPSTGTGLTGAQVFVLANVFPLVSMNVHGIALTVLVLSIHRRWRSPPHGRLRLYRLVEFIGRWSLLDIYVLTLLVALVQLHALATVEPRPGAVLPSSQRDIVRVNDADLRT
jgi:uncharacterized paraquat-inducible protein A